MTDHTIPDGATVILHAEGKHLRRRPARTKTRKRYTIVGVDDALTLECQRIRQSMQVQWPKSKNLRLSLVSLVTEQGFTLTDVALFFGVSRESVRLWCNRLGVARTWGGPSRLRVWDDTRHRFVPVSITTYKTEQAKQRAYDNTHARALKYAARIDTLRAYVDRFRERRGRDPVIREIVATLPSSATYAQRQHGPFLAAYVGFSTTRGSQLAQARKAIGLKPGIRGYAGWTKASKIKHPRRLTPSQ